MALPRVACASLLLAAASFVHAAPPKPEPELQMSVRGEIDIDTDGSVRDFRPTSRLTPALASIVGDKVRTWRFEPVLVDGKPVVANTSMRLELRAIPHEGDYQLRIEDVGFGDPRAGKYAPPRYPMKAVREGLGASVLIAVRLDADGKVAEMHPYQTSLSKSLGSENNTRKWREVFERASMEAIAQWTFEITERLDGRAESQTMLAPITFTIGSPSSSPEGRFLSYIPGPIVPAPWLDAEAVASVDAADLASAEQGSTRSLSSRVRLATDLEGSIL